MCPEYKHPEHDNICNILQILDTIFEHCVESDITMEDMNDISLLTMYYCNITNLDAIVNNKEIYVLLRSILDQLQITQITTAPFSNIKILTLDEDFIETNYDTNIIELINYFGKI